LLFLFATHESPLVYSNKNWDKWSFSWDHQSGPFLPTGDWHSFSKRALLLPGWSGINSSCLARNWWPIFSC